MVGSRGARRREPVQERARQRREQILDATARLLEREGFAATNTNAVAREAGASVGTIYEYFPNKEALFAGLLERYRQLLGARLARAFVGEGGRALIERLFDAFVDFYRHQPGYRELWLGSQLSQLLMTTGRRWGEAFAAELAPALGQLAPSLSAERRLIVTRAALQLVSALVSAALQSGDDEEALIAEARVALHRYLEPELR